MAAINALLNAPIDGLSCASLFGRYQGQGAAEMLQNAFSGTAATLQGDIVANLAAGNSKIIIRMADLGAGVTATTGGVTARLGDGSVLWDGQVITINTNPDGFFGRSENDLAASILHELGHAMYNLTGGSAGVFPDAGNPDASVANTQTVKNYCGLN